MCAQSRRERRTIQRKTRDSRSQRVVETWGDDHKCTHGMHSTHSHTMDHREHTHSYNVKKTNTSSPQHTCVQIHTQKRQPTNQRTDEILSLHTRDCLRTTDQVYFCRLATRSRTPFCPAKHISLVGFITLFEWGSSRQSQARRTQQSSTPPPPLAFMYVVRVFESSITHTHTHTCVY